MPVAGPFPDKQVVPLPIGLTLVNPERALHETTFWPRRKTRFCPRSFDTLSAQWQAVNDAPPEF